MKSAYALLRKGKILIQSYSRATTGLWIATGPVFVIDEGDPDALGTKIRYALNGSIEGVQHPSQAEWKTVQGPMLEAAGVKTWATLAKSAKSVGLEFDGGIVKMVPTAGYGNNGGKSLPEKAVECEFDNDELGSALVLAFERCE
jgi:hypothetical protein